LKVAVVGLGYVGLPLAVALARKHDVTGFDISPKRVADLKQGRDSTNEVAADELSGAKLTITNEPADLNGREIFIVTVPTPIDAANRPDFTAMLTACEIVGPALGKAAIVVFESTVYPGVTEEICAPALERSSGLKAGADFKLGYSPERINPGDKAHPIEKIVKVVAGQDAKTLDTLAELYGSVIEAGVHRAPSIKVAEAAKAIENTQRDLNIALMNEVAKICHLLGIRTRDVLDAAGTKWNFLKFHPGLVGGHCIGVDPYYLTAKAEQLGYQPEVILSGRRINDRMGAYLAQCVVKLIAASGQPIDQARVGILGFTFKENVPDIRNSKVIDVYRELTDFGIEPVVHDARADPAAVRHEYGVELSPLGEFRDLRALIYAVGHDEYRPLHDQISDMVAEGGIIADVRSLLDAQKLRPDIRYWSL
jgi:UDP-N-acetyl-D-glucosamine/UDP-N-acetyl-D-galactosamine dehydrogenase